MLNRFQKFTLITTILAGTCATHASAQTLYCGKKVVRSTPAPAVQATPAPTTGVVYQVVQATPQYDLRRPEVVSGSRVTLFANFLRQEPGVVLFNLNGTSTECTLVEWQPNSVTIELPRLGLIEPKNAEIQIVLPDGRVAKKFSVLFISQPDIVIHQDTIPQPMPPAPVSHSAVYAASVQGGLMLTTGIE